MAAKAEQGVDVAAALAFLLLDRADSIYGAWTGTMSAAEQRARFGRVVWGRKTVTIDGAREEVRWAERVCFGLDWNIHIHTFAGLTAGETI